MLIIGGLVAVGVIALIGALLLALGEGRGAGEATATQTIPAASQTSASVSQTEVPQVENARDTAEAHNGHSEHTESMLDVQSPVYSSGQFHEVVIQIQKLHEQSEELQARLSQLNEIVEQMEQRASYRVDLPRARRIS